MSYDTEKIEKLFKQLHDTVFSLNLEFDKLKKDNESKQEEIESFEEAAALDESAKVYCEIECGIGKIEYREPQNIALADLMENLESAMVKTNFRKVNEHLQAIV